MSAKRLYHCDGPDCNVTFLRLPCQAKGKRHFCSNGCHARWQSVHMCGSQAGPWQGGSVETTCAHCGAALIRTRWMVGKYGKSFCNQSCKGAWRREHERGENNPLWRGGGGGRGRVNSVAHNWSKDIRRRAGWRCEKCGKPSTKKRPVHAHHIFPYAGNPELREAPENGICLCYECHRNVHAGTLRVQRRMTYEQAATA